MYRVTLDDEYWFRRNISSGTSTEFEPVFVYDVESYEFSNFVSLLVTTTTEPRITTILNPEKVESRTLYCCMDSQHSSNFGHFFWESFVFLKEYRRLIRNFPRIIFLLGTRQRFKSKILDSYGFKYAYEITDKNNVVAFMPPITSLVTNKYTHYYSKLIDQFHFEIQLNAPSSLDKDILICYFPRHKTLDNTFYEGQNRSYDTTELAEFLNMRPDCVVFDTESSESWEQEISLVRRSKILIFHDGSSAAVLGFHAKDSVLIALSNNVMVPSMRRFDKVYCIQQKMSSFNEQFFVRDPANRFGLSLLHPLINNQIIGFPFLRNV